MARTHGSSGEHGSHSGEGEGGEPRRPHVHGATGSAHQLQEGVYSTLDGGEADPSGRRAASSSPAESDVTLSSAVDDPQATARTYVDSLATDPRSVAGKSAEEIAERFNTAGYSARVEGSTKKGTSGKAVQVRVDGHPTITNVQVHPGGGRHTPEGSPYWKISTSTQGKTWVVPSDFRGADQLGGNVVRYDE